MLIKLNDYKRIHQIVTAAVVGAEIDLKLASVLYGTCGAKILSDHFKIDAQVRCGLAAYHLGGKGDDGSLMFFGEEISSELVCTGQNFHCWIEADGWVVDFMAPLFTTRPRMFQKRISEMGQHPYLLQEAGEFFHSHDPNFHEIFLGKIAQAISAENLADICTFWFKKAPKAIFPWLEIVDQNDYISRTFELMEVNLNSRW